MNKYTLLLGILFSTSSFAAGIEVPLTSKYTPSERVKTTYGSDHLEGVINGIKYSRYSDGSARFDNPASKKTSLSNHWSIGCSEDQMTDKKMCDVSNGQSNLFIILEKGKGVTRITLFGHDFPGKDLSIRAGDSKPVSARKFVTGGVARNLIAQMKGGIVVKTRHYDWPYDYPKDNKATISGKGLTEALKYAEWVLAGDYTVGAPADPTVETKSPKVPVKVSATEEHTHGERSHSHPLPAQGKAHQHGGGPVGK